jgi:fatty acid desaturase
MNNEFEEKEKSAPDLPPPPTEEELRKAYEDEIRARIRQQNDNIAFRCVYLLLGLLITAGGLSIVFSGGGGWVFGLVISIIGILFTIHSVVVLRQWIALLKIFKEEKKKITFDRDADK